MNINLHSEQVATVRTGPTDDAPINDEALPKQTPDHDSAQIPQQRHDLDLAATPGALRQEYVPGLEEGLLSEAVDDAKMNCCDRALRQLAKVEAPQRLDAAVAIGADIISKLQTALEQMPDHPDQPASLQQLENVRLLATPTKTVVGVIGNMGAGKSSIINAIIDEERLLPTSCMRACTAVVTELSQNDSTRPGSEYRARIEFIQPDEWREDLEMLFRDIVDENGRISNEVNLKDSPANIAYSKVRAVYPKMSKERIAQMSVEQLMSVKRVAKVLGTTRHINETLPAVFYERLKQYVDSKEKVQGNLDSSKNGVADAAGKFEYWPLIKVVKIYTKSEALSKGSVVVDLPGVHDSNAARAAVAENYRKQCSALWIVTPINRAVDDKAAKMLLGDSFKRQLKYDGIYSAVTFICSKTDEIRIDEAADGLQLGSTITEIDNEISALRDRKRELRVEQKTSKESRAVFQAAFDDADNQIEDFETLNGQIEDGKPVYWPLQKQQKRKRRNASKPKRKKARRCSDADDDAFDAHSELSNDEGPTDKGQIITGDEIKAKLAELHDLKKAARRERTGVDSRLQDIARELEQVDGRLEELKTRPKELCIQGRNEYSRSAVREDFAVGIRELDQENAEDDDPNNFDPLKDKRDYGEVARSLPVFCVSSHAYQKLSGRMRKDDEITGFLTKDQTEIPQLQLHCQALTEERRRAAGRRFLNSLKQFLTSLNLWLNRDGSAADLSVQQLEVEKLFLSNRLDELKKALETVISNTLDDCRAELDEQLFERFPQAATKAAVAALRTSDGWEGLHWSTYKAVVRRDGIHSTPAAGAHDFNAALSKPIYKHLASTWEKMFQRQLPDVLKDFAKTATDEIGKFHTAVEARLREKGHNVAQIGPLKTQLNTYQITLSDLTKAMATRVNEKQRPINRQFTSAITAAMGPAYAFCAATSGTGLYGRMKDHMHDYISSNKNKMFTASCDQVRENLETMCKSVQAKMLDQVNSVFVNIQRDYMAAIDGDIMSDTMSGEERSARQLLDEIITNAGAELQNVINADDETLLKIVETHGKYRAAELVEAQIDGVEEVDDRDDGVDDLDDLEEEEEDGAAGGGK